jgi:hypothetical protein
MGPYQIWIPSRKTCRANNTRINWEVHTLPPGQLWELRKMELLDEDKEEDEMKRRKIWR